MAFQGSVTKAGKQDRGRICIHMLNGINDPVAAYQGFGMTSRWRQAADLAIPFRLLRDDDAQGTYAFEVRRQVYPVRLFIQLGDCCLIQAQALVGGVEHHELDHLQLCLGAVDPLHEQAVFGPVHARQILVGRVAPIIAPPLDLGHDTGLHLQDEQIDDGIRPARARIALLNDRHVVGGNVEARYDIYRALIHARIGDISVVGAPPIARISAHLFLSDEFGHPI